MSLNDRLSTLGQMQTKSRCPAQRLIETLDPETAETLVGLLADQSTSTSAIHRELRVENYKIGRDVLASHRNGTCYCRATV